jgi:hypothetical protein
LNAQVKKIKKIIIFFLKLKMDVYLSRGHLVETLFLTSRQDKILGSRPGTEKKKIENGSNKSTLRAKFPSKN